MSARKPPRLADWLLDRSGFTRENPPLAGDLLEEFRSGRSAAWFWRQTLVVLWTGVMRRVRQLRRPLAAAVVGWVCETGVTFALWRFHLPPKLPDIFGTIMAVVACSYVLWSFRKAPVRPADEGLSSEADENLLMCAAGPFVGLLMAYCVVALFWGFSPGFFIFSQVVWLLIWVVKDVLASAPASR